MERFVPKLLSSSETTVTIENLLEGTSDQVRLIDVKMGTSTVTKKAKHTPGKVDYRLQKDARTSTPVLGFCICGLKTPDQHLFKIHTKIELDQVKETLR